MIAEFFFIMLVYPCELIKTRRQVASVSNLKGINFMKAVNGKGSKILENLYKGISPYLLTYVLYTGLEFALYLISMKILNTTDDTSSTVYKIIVSSLISAIISNLFTNPL